MLPQGLLLAGRLYGVLQLALLLGQILLVRLLLLPGVPVLLAFGQPGGGITGQCIPQGRQSLLQRHPMLLLLLLQMGQAFVDALQRLPLIELILIQ